MPASPEEARAQERPYEQKGLLGPDGIWLSKRARQNQAGSTSVASPVDDGWSIKIRRADGQSVAGDSSEDEDGWRIAERYCIDYRGSMDMDEIIENVFMRATEFMHQSGMRMDADHVGKPQDLYLWCSVGGAKNWGLWGCPMRFTTGCPCAIRIA